MWSPQKSLFVSKDIKRQIIKTLQLKHWYLQGTVLTFAITPDGPGPAASCGLRVLESLLATHLVCRKTGEEVLDRTTTSSGSESESEWLELGSYTDPSPSDSAPEVTRTSVPSESSVRSMTSSAGRATKPLLTGSTRPTGTAGCTAAAGSSWSSSSLLLLSLVQSGSTLSTLRPLGTTNRDTPMLPNVCRNRTDMTGNVLKHV